MLSIQQLHNAIIEQIILPNFADDVTHFFQPLDGNYPSRYSIAELDHPVTKTFKLVLNILNAVDEINNQGRWQKIKTLWSISDEIRQWSAYIDIPLLEQVSLTLGLNMNFSGIFKRIRKAATFDKEEIYSALSVFFHFHSQKNVPTQVANREDDSTYLYNLFNQSMTNADPINDPAIWIQCLGGVVRITQYYHALSHISLIGKVGNIHSLVKNYKKLHYYIANKDRQAINDLLLTLSYDVVQMIHEWNTSLRNIHLLFTQIEVEYMLKPGRLTHKLKPLALLIQNLAALQSIDIELTDMYPYELLNFRNLHYLHSSYLSWSDDQKKMVNRLECFRAKYSQSGYSRAAIPPSFDEMENDCAEAINALQLSDDEQAEMLDMLEDAVIAPTESSLVKEFFTSFIGTNTLPRWMALYVIGVHPRALFAQLCGLINNRMHDAIQRAERRSLTYQVLAAHHYERLTIYFPRYAGIPMSKINPAVNPLRENCALFDNRHTINQKFDTLKHAIIHFAHKVSRMPYKKLFATHHPEGFSPEFTENTPDILIQLKILLRLLHLVKAFVNLVHIPTTSKHQDIFPFMQPIIDRVQDGLYFRRLNKAKQKILDEFSQLQSQFNASYFVSRTKNIDFHVIKKSSMEEVIKFLFNVNIKFEDEPHTDNPSADKSEVVPRSQEDMTNDLGCLMQKVITVFAYYHNFMRGLHVLSADNDVVRSGINTFENIIRDYENSGMEADSIQHMRNLANLFRLFQEQGDSHNPATDAKFYLALNSLYSSEWDKEVSAKPDHPALLDYDPKKQPYIFHLIKEPAELMSIIERLRVRYFEIGSFSDVIDTLYKTNSALVTVVQTLQILLPNLYCLFDRIEAENFMPYGALSGQLDQGAYFVSMLANRMGMKTTNISNLPTDFPYAEYRKDSLARYADACTCIRRSAMITKYRATHQRDISTALHQVLDKNRLERAKNRLQVDIDSLSNAQQRIAKEIFRLQQEHRFYDYNMRKINLYRDLHRKLGQEKINVQRQLSKQLTPEMVQRINSRITSATQNVAGPWAFDNFQEKVQTPQQQAIALLIAYALITHLKSFLIWISRYQLPKTNLDVMRKQHFYMPFLNDRPPKSAKFIEDMITSCQYRRAAPAA